MAINKNHEFEELDGVKCAIVEKNVSPERVYFLKKLLEYNKFKVVVISSPPPKAASAAIIIEGDEAQPVESPSSPVETFTVGVTDYTFNPVNAIFGRLLHTSDGHVVTLAFWLQKELTSHDDIPYFEIDRG
jgi:hypothetical protein